MIEKFHHLSSTWIVLLNRLSIFIIILSVSVGCNKEEENYSINETNYCLVEVNGSFEEVTLEEMPEYLNGGYEGMTNAIFSKLKYPAEARENGIEGLCVIVYDITTEGIVENIKAIQNPGGGIGDSAVEVFGSATDGVSFSPGIFDDMPVKVRKEMQFEFKLE